MQHLAELAGDEGHVVDRGPHVGQLVLQAPVGLGQRAQEAPRRTGPGVGEPGLGGDQRGVEVVHPTDQLGAGALPLAQRLGGVDHAARRLGRRHARRRQPLGAAELGAGHRDHAERGEPPAAQAVVGRPEAVTGPIEVGGDGREGDVPRRVGIEAVLGRLGGVEAGEGVGPDLEHLPGRQRAVDDDGDRDAGHDRQGPPEPRPPGGLGRRRVVTGGGIPCSRHCACSWDGVGHTA